MDARERADNLPSQEFRIDAAPEHPVPSSFFDDPGDEFSGSIEQGVDPRRVIAVRIEKYTLEKQTNVRFLGKQNGVVVEQSVQLGASASDIQLPCHLGEPQLANPCQYRREQRLLA